MEYALTERFLDGLPQKYHDRVDSVDKQDYGYLVYLNHPWYQSDDDQITTVIGCNLSEARREVMRAQNINKKLSKNT